MELFSLLAKLVLDTKEYDREVSRVQGQDLDGPEMSLGLDTEEYDTGVDNVNNKSDLMGEHVGGIFEGIKSAIVAAGITTILTSITKLISDCVNKAATMGDEIDKGSKRMGISTDNYQRWNHALGQSGGAITDLSRGMKNFRAILAEDKVVTEEEQKALEELGINTAGKTREQLHDLALQALETADAQKEHAGAVEVLNSLMSDNEPAGTQAAALKELGVETRKANGELKTSEELMRDTILALADMTDTDKRDNLADVLFGPNSGGLKPLLDEGREGVKALLDEADDLGIIMSEEEVQNAVKYGDALANLKSEVTAIQTAFVQDLMPVLTQAVDWLTDLLKLFNPRLRENSLSETFKDIDKATTASGQRIDETSAKAQALIEKLDGMGDYWSLDSTGQKTWDTLAAEFIAIEPEFESYIDLENKKIKENTDVIKENIRQWTIREKQRLLDENTAKKREALAAQYAKAEEKLIEAAVAETEAEGKRVTAIENLNGLLERYGLDTLSEDATQADIEQAQKDILKADNGRNTNLQFEVSNATKEYNEARAGAIALREEAEKLEAEADEMAEKVEKYEAALAKRLKLTTDEVNRTTDAFRNLKRELQSMPDDVNVGVNIGGSGLRMFKQAKGDWSVPYDDYPSLLHRGEMVLTASEARRYRESDGSGLDLSGLRGEIVDAIKEGMADATVNSYLDGRQVTDEISRRMAAEAANRRYG